MPPLIAARVAVLVVPGPAPRFPTASVPVPGTVIETLVMTVIAPVMPVCAPALCLHLAGGSQRREREGERCNVSFHGDS